ncbi:YbgA family protein [Fictibacillus nanhaiensis]|uniref:DUF1722 domain-containing protein n=1 Tax=Fictibacillus nanhaiensis TaxID=742169 RepID=UPI001C978660|nr:DUF1722 domain-containing protein [Fictibacillus nanhaiensis]MBY6037329.1 YbgA family protein [Fictibacillus nanhaiensis]
MKKETERLWASEKYTVMAKGYNFYKDIQGKMRDAETVKEYEAIEELISVYREEPFDTKAIINTFEHVWGYFKKSADEKEKEQFFSLLKELKSSDTEKMESIPPNMMLFLQDLLKKYPSDYLSRSTFIKK